MDKFVTPDQSLRREQVEKIVKTNAPKAYAKVGLDRLLTTAQMKSTGWLTLVRKSFALCFPTLTTTTQANVKKFSTVIAAGWN